MDEVEGVAYTPTVLMRVYYSSYHLWGAQHFASLAGEIEDAYNGRSTFNIKHRAYVTNSLLSSVAFMEAAVNELYQDAFDEHSSYLSPLSQETRNLLADFWNMTEKENKSTISLLDKYQLALRFCGREPLSKGDSPYQEVESIVKIRNALTHYKPQSLGGDNVHRLEGRLRGKFQENKLMSGSGNPYFPDKVLGRGCADWAVASARTFTDKFFSEIEVVPNYQRVNFNENI
jgi:hypothetical protein